MTTKAPTLRALAVIPARGGSKGVPGKNLRSVAGKPLLQYLAEAVATVADVKAILSTDSEEIAALGESLGLSAPFRRPATLAGDHSPTVAAVLHAAETMQTAGWLFPAVLVLQPTAPLVAPEDIETALRRVTAEGFDSACAVTPVREQPEWMVRVGADGAVRPLSPEGIRRRRQECEPLYIESGQVVAVRTESLFATRSLYGARHGAVIVPRERAVDLDTEEDFAMLEALLQSRRRP